VTGKTVVPEEAVEAARTAVQNETYGAEWAGRIAVIAVNAAAPFIAAKAWDEGYSAGKRVMVEVMSPTHFATEKPNPHRAAAVRGEG